LSGVSYAQSRLAALGGWGGAEREGRRGEGSGKVEAVPSSFAKKLAGGWGMNVKVSVSVSGLGGEEAAD